jgi:hypothetical protein
VVTRLAAEKRTPVCSVQCKAGGRAVAQRRTFGSIATVRSLHETRQDASSGSGVPLSLPDSSFQSKALEHRKETTMASRLLTRNMGTFDRAVRALVFAPVAIGNAVGLGATSIGGIVLLALAGIALTTAATGVCPAYIPFGIDTRGRMPLPHRPLKPQP